MPFRCRACRKQLSVRTSTLMQSSRLGLHVWTIAVYFMLTGIKGTAAMKLHRDLGVPCTSAWRLAHRIRETWRVASPAFAGPVEADKTYVCGLEKNRHAYEKLYTDGWTISKSSVAGVRDRATGRVSADVVPNSVRPTMRTFVRERRQLGAPVYTDEALAYRVLPYHESVRHSVHEWVNDQAHTNILECSWSFLKRGHHGINHMMSPKRLHRHVRDLAGGHSQCALDTIDRTRRMVHGILGKQPTSAGLAA